jgi:phage protein D
MIEIAGKEASDLYRDVTEVQVELDDEEAATFRIELSLTMGSDGSWTHTDDERFAPWTPVVISVGFGSAPQKLMSGYLTGTQTTFDADRGRCKLELIGSDGSALLDRVERLRVWPDKKDSDIAKDIFAEYGLTAVVDDTKVLHEAVVSTVVQRETDLQFLGRLSLRNGFETFVEHDKGYFRAPPAAAAPQPVLAAHFGAATNVIWFTVQVDAREPGEVGMFQLDRAEKIVLKALATSSAVPALGKDRGSDLVPSGIKKAKAYVAMSATTGVKEMAPLCQSLFDRGEWFVTGEGLADGNRYGSILQARKPVTIKGVGERHSGLYAVTHVTHTVNAGGYSQKFAVKRNGLRPTGSEDFEGSSGGLLGGLL